MSIIDYGDFAYSSEEENQQMEEQDGYGHEEEAASVRSDHASDEVDHLNDDVEEYAHFDSDLEKYQYDQLRWNGIANSRKYTIAQKKDKGETKGQKTKRSKEDEPQAIVEPAKRSKPKAFPHSTRKGKGAVKAPMEPVVDIPKEGEIHFDTTENLWYTYKKIDIYITERATFHHWIRPGLSRIENAKGTYDFARKRGPGNFNITCFNEVERHWGLQRPHYAPVMFEWERLDRKDPTYPLGNLYYQGLLVIDYWRTPVRNFLEIPLVISSAFEGGYMEPATRLHSEIAYEDIRARMSPFIEITKNDATHFKALSKASTFSGRSRHFREKAGAICWDKREGSSKIKSFIEEIVRPVDNSTKGSRDLTKDEVKRLRLMNYGTKPGRAKPGTSKESKEKYIASTRKAAGLPATVSGEEAGGEDDDKQELEVTDEDMTLAVDDDHQEPADQSEETFHVENDDFLYEDQEDQVLDELMVSTEDNHSKEDESMVMDVSDTAPPRFVFRFAEHPCLRAMTEEEAFMHPMLDILDPRNRIPKFPNEHRAIRDALQVTVDHFKEIFGTEPKMSEGSNYISEYCSIQDQMDEVFPDDATALRRLGRWEGTVFDWERAQVEENPCIGRRQPFGSSSLDAIGGHLQIIDTGLRYP